jgi:hypothetical protein
MLHCGISRRMENAEEGRHDDHNRSDP